MDEPDRRKPVRDALDALIAQFDGAPEAVLVDVLECAAAGLAMRRGHWQTVQVTVLDASGTTTIFTGPERAPSRV